MADARSERHPAVRRPQQPAAHPAEERSGGRFRFVQESWAELKKVEWPGQNQVIQGTVVVLVACVVVGTYLYLNDIVWKHVVSKLFLGQ
jgi:preprotein translocase SecE subunit